MEETLVIAKALVDSKGIELIKTELKSVKPVVVLQSNSKFEIRRSKPNVDPKAVLTGVNVCPKNLKLSNLKSGYSETVCPDHPENFQNCLSKFS